MYRTWLLVSVVVLAAVLKLAGCDREGAPAAPAPSANPAPSAAR